MVERVVVDRVVLGRIATLAGASGLAEVEAIAIADGVVVQVGKRADIEALAGPATERWRLPPGTCVVPGMTDAHLHLGMAAAAATGVRLGGLPDRAAVWAAIAEAHAARVAAGDREGWLLGDGWSLDQLGDWPTGADLERLAPSRPVALWSHDHHARWASPAALVRAGIGALHDGPVGLVRRDGSGAPTGVLHEAAATLLDPSIPAATVAERAAALQRYAVTLAALGVTGVHDPGDLAVSAALDAVLLYRALAEEGRLPLRVAASVREIQLEAAIAAVMRTGQGGGRGSGRARDGWLKLFADGSLGSRSAALLMPYEAGDPGGSPVGGPAGMITHDPDDMLLVAMRAAVNGIAVQIHGIGDAAVRAALDVLEHLPRVAGVAHRVEHAQLVDQADIPRFGRAGIAASVQPCHLCSDAPAVEHAWGARSRDAFPIAALDRAGTLIPFGTDAPVESPDPWRNLAAAVRRCDPSWPTDRGLFHPEQSIDVTRALRAACLDPALALGHAGLGRLLPGSPADLVVIPWDGLADPGTRGEHLAATRPMATLIDGAVVYRRDDFDP